MDTKKVFNVVFLLASSLFVILALDLNSVAQANKETKSERLLKEVKANYKPFQGKGTFIVSYQGKIKSEIDVIVIEVGSAVAFLADSAAGREIDLTPEKMRKLLEFNSRSDYIKVGISDLGSIRVQSEQNLLILNAKVFGEILDQVAAGADEVAQIIGPIKKKGAALN